MVDLLELNSSGVRVHMCLTYVYYMGEKNQLESSSLSNKVN